MTDAIVLTIPRDRRFHAIAHLVLGGLGARLNLTIETLEDVQLALDALLERREADEPVTLEVRLLDDQIETVVGPFRSDSIRSELESEGDGELGLRRVLDTVADRVELDHRDGAYWVRLTKASTPVGAA